MLRIDRVLAPNPGLLTLEGTNTWVVGSHPSIVIDPGPDDPDHLVEVARTAGPTAAVLVTHDHDDHAEGAFRLGSLVAAPVFARRLDGATPLAHEQRFEAGGCEVVAIDTPGHSADHVAFFLSAEGALFTGDAVLGRGTSFIDPPDGDLIAYLASLGRMLELRPRVIHPGHGPLVPDAAATLREYVEHRLERERQVVQALADGPRTLNQLVEGIYVGYPQDVHPLAARSLTSHLLKLLHEGRVTKHGRGRTQTWAATGGEPDS